MEHVPAFVAGFVATLLFHQGQAGIQFSRRYAGRNPTHSML